MGFYPTIIIMMFQKLLILCALTGFAHSSSRSQVNAWVILMKAIPGDNGQMNGKGFGVRAKLTKPYKDLNLPKGTQASLTNIYQCTENHTKRVDKCSTCTKKGKPGWLVKITVGGTLPKGVTNPLTVTKQAFLKLPLVLVRRRRLGDTAAELLARHRLANPYRDSPVLLRLLEKIRRAQRA